MTGLLPLPAFARTCIAAMMAAIGAEIARLPRANAHGAHDHEPQAMSLIHDRASHRFRMPLEEGGEAILDYAERDSGALDLLHTEVPSHARGQGHGSALVEQVLRHAREQGLRVLPSCPFVAKYVREHPEHADLIG